MTVETVEQRFNAESGLRRRPMAAARATGRRRVILTGGEYLGGLAAVRALEAAGYDPWVAVSSTASYAARSRSAGGVVQVPELREDAEGFGRALADAASRLGAVAVLPGSDGAQLALAAHAGLFPDTVALGTCALGIVEQAVDKDWLRQATAPAGLKTPPTVCVTASDVERGAAEDLRLPAVVKPVRSEMLVDHGGLEHFGVRRVESQVELVEALRKLPRERGLVQPYLDGRIVTVNGVSWGGEVVCAVHQIADRIWPPDCGVVSYAETVPPDMELEEATRRLLRGLRWSGLFNLQFIARDGERYVIDLNPRVYVSLALAWCAGLNLPAIWVSLMLGEPVSAHGYREGVRFRSEISDLRAILAALRRGERRRALAGLMPRRGTEHAVWSVRDPRPVLTELARVRSWVGRRIRARFDR